MLAINKLHIHQKFFHIIILERPGTALFWYKVAPFCGGLVLAYISFIEF